MALPEVSGETLNSLDEFEEAIRRPNFVLHSFIHSGAAEKISGISERISFT